MLKIDKVSYSFKNAIGNNVGILDEICFKLNPGEITSLLGKSGSGKTTLLNIIVGILKQTRGTIESEFSRPSKNISYYNQNAGLLPWRTAGENVMLAGDLLDISIDKKLVAELIDLLGLKGKMNSYPDELSGGELQRFALIQRLILSPKLLVLDEPFGALDVVLRRELSGIIKNFVRSNNLLALVVTHQPEDALFLSDHILILSKVGESSTITRRFSHGKDFEDSSFYPHLVAELAI